MKELKKGMYFVVPRFVVEGLQLPSGPLRDIYSIIYGFSQDGESSCDCNLNYFAEWTLSTTRTVRECISLLCNAGYITRQEIGVGRGSYVQYKVNQEIIAKIEKGEKFSSFKKGEKFSKKAEVYDQKGGKNFPLTNVNNNIIIYNNILSRVPRTCEEQKKEFYKFFFFKNCLKPLAETEAFMRVAELDGWKDGKGRKLDTWKKKLIWADGWKINNGTGRIADNFLECLLAIYNGATEQGDPIAEQFVDARIKITSDKNSATVWVTQAVAEWIEIKIREKGYVYRALGSFLQGRRFSYQFLMDIDNNQ